MSQCNSEEGPVRNLRNVIIAVESALNALIKLGLASDIIIMASKYLTIVTTFVNQAAQVLEDAALGMAQKAAKILALGASVILPHFEDARVQAALTLVQNAVALFLSMFQSQPPANVSVNQKTKDALEKIEKDANLDTAKIAKWANEPKPVPTK